MFSAWVGSCIRHDMYSKAIQRRLLGMPMFEGLVFRPICHLNAYPTPFRDDAKIETWQCKVLDEGPFVLYKLLDG